MVEAFTVDWEDSKWVDFKAMEPMAPKVEPEDIHKAQLMIVVTARRAGLSNMESKAILDQLGIGERVDNDDLEGD